MSLLGGGKKPFLETNAWQHSNLNSLRYNTSQAGSVIPIIYGTTRQQINLIGFGDFRGPGGKKGKNGPLPIEGQHAGKGGGGGKKGGKKNADFSIDVDFAICQGPVDIGDTNKVWASPGIAFFQSVGLNLYTGEDGQAADPVFEGLGQIVGYSGTCHVTGTPMDLGSSPVIPNLSFEVTGFEVGTCGPGFPHDANPASAIQDFLTNLRYGAGWPSENLDPDIATPGSNNYGDYCQAGLFAISPALQAQTDAATWVSELARLTNTAIVWSGSTLKFIPYGDIALAGNGASWTPNLTPLYSFTDDDFLPWNPHIDAHDPQLGEDDPVLVTRSNPADATNWMSIEYLDRENSYNKMVIPQFDQASIDLYGIRTESAIQGGCFCDKLPASVSLRLLLQRALYVRNTYKFQVGWQYALLEPMDIVLLTDPRCGLFEQPVRITAIEENDNGDLTIDAEEIKVDEPIETGCAIGDVDWRLAAPTFVNGDQMPADRIDALGNFYVNDPPGGAINEARIYDSGGGLVSSLSYGDLWEKIFSFAGVDHDPIFGDDSTDFDYSGYYKLWPIHDGEYVLAFIQRVMPPFGPYGFWWALLDPNDLSVLGAYYYAGLVVWPYAGGYHILGANDPDLPILVQSYGFIGGSTALIGVLPSINEFKDESFGAGIAGHPFRIKNTILYPMGTISPTDTDFSNYLLLHTATDRNMSRNFGFLLPDANGGINYYIYINRKMMDYFGSGVVAVPPKFRDVIQPAHPDGCMVKIPLGDISFAALSDVALAGVLGGDLHGQASGDYSIDDAAWREEDNVTPAIPFLDEYTHITDDTAGGDDCYALQTSVINRGNGKFWIVFYMVGNADAHYRSGEPAWPGYVHPIYERVRVFEYTQSSETAREIFKTTCVLHTADDLAPDGDSLFWEASNDNYQIFTVEDQGRVAVLHIYGHLFNRPFCSFTIPLNLLP